ncbi:MAG: GNAT family N-acetyltransferase [Arenimonas sp.]|nr:GNAT family N-acetyltransferase [Arenimonas sp.]MBP6626725.1 GNAT family N-acetyltransferase [Arenimonas sp.]
MPSAPSGTERLVLEELDAQDAGFILALLNTPGFLHFIGDRGVRCVEDALGYLAQGPCASYANHGYGLWKVRLRATGQTVGMSGLVRRETLPHADLGYAFLPEHSGQGLASEAGAAVLRHAFGNLGMGTVLAIVQPGNAGSIRVLEKLGYLATGLRDFNGELLQVYAVQAPR